MRKNAYYTVLFAITALLIIALGIILNLWGYNDLSAVALSIGSSVFAVVIVNKLWEFSGGEPILTSLRILEQASTITSDAIETGVRRVFYNRRSLDYELFNEQIAHAKEVFILSLVLRIVQSLEFRDSLIDCVKNGGRVRILISNPKTIRDHEHELPSPLLLRQHAEQDLKNGRMSAEINDTIDFLKDISNEISSKWPDKIKNFQFRLVSDYVIYCHLTGIDEMLYVTQYTNKRQGLSCPTMQIERTNRSSSLYRRYEDEFQFLWDKSSSLNK